MLCILESTGEQTDRLRDEAMVHDRDSMERVLSTLQQLLAGGTQGSIGGPADLRILQDFPPLALPEGGGGGLTHAASEEQELRTNSGGRNGFLKTAHFAPRTRGHPLPSLPSRRPRRHHRRRVSHRVVRWTLHPFPLAQVHHQ